MDDADALSLDGSADAFDEPVSLDIGGNRSNPLSVAEKAAEASGKGPQKDGLATSLAHAALQSFPEERSEDDLDLIYQYLVHLPSACRRFFNLRASRSNLRYLCKHLKLLTPTRGTLIYKQGQVGDKFYVIVDGVCEVLHAPVVMASGARGSLGRLGETGGAGVMVSTAEERRALGCRVGVLPSGECFGENSIGLERDSSVICNGLEVQGKQFPAQILQVDGKAYRRCIQVMFQTVEAVLRRRSTRLKKLFVFSGWPDTEYNFFSYWMKEITYEPGATIYEAGDPVSYVYFLSSGTVNFSVETDKRPGVDFVVEMVSAPSYFGEIEVVDRLESRQHKVWVPPGEPAVMAAIPVNVFWRLLLSELPSVAYETADRLEKLVTARHSWHQLRVDDAEESGDVHHSLLHEIQTRFLGCPLCGEVNHMPEDCELSDETKLPSHNTVEAAAEAEAAAAAEAAKSSPAPGTPLSGVRNEANGTPASGAALVARRNLGMASASGTPRSGMSMGSARSKHSKRSNRSGSPTGTPRSRRTRTPGGSGGGSVDGDDWNTTKKKVDAAESKLDPKARLFLQEARADIRSVMKAVVQFKRLVARRRAERAAANGGVDPLSHGLTSASNGAGGGAGAGSGTGSGTGSGSGSGRGVPPSSVNITPIEFDSGDVISGSLPRPVGRQPSYRKSKSVSDITPLPRAMTRRYGRAVSMGEDVKSPTYAARRLRPGVSSGEESAVSASGSYRTGLSLSPKAGRNGTRSTVTSPKAATGSFRRQSSTRSKKRVSKKS